MPTLPQRRPSRAHPLTGALASLAVLAACSGGANQNAGAGESAAAPADSPAAAPQAPAPQSAAAPAAPAVPQVDPENVGASIQWDSAAKKVTLPNITGLTSTGGGWNFNGYAGGNATLVVPVGSTVEMTYVNGDAHPHSVGIVAGSPNAIPSMPGDPAFRNAVSARFLPGMAPNAKDVVRFTADKPGTYLMICGVPGHATSGMWIKFQVSSSAKAPAWKTS